MPRSYMFTAVAILLCAVALLVRLTLIRFYRSQRKLLECSNCADVVMPLMSEDVRYWPKTDFVALWQT